jgi:hypothetical protein
VKYMARHDPWVIGGFLLLGMFAVLFFHVQVKMREIGYKTIPLFAKASDWELPRLYLRVRTKHNWSPWPVYLMWPCLAFGLFLLVFGFFRL